jgi:hypothetical protein
MISKPVFALARNASLQFYRLGEIPRRHKFSKRPSKILLEGISLHHCKLISKVINGST